MTRSVFLQAYQEMLQHLIQARRRACITQIQLAGSLGMPQSFVSRYESGDRRIDVVEFLLICRALGADPVKILTAVYSSLENK